MNIEMLGVNAVKDEIAKTDYLNPHINDNDKEPSWDGKIEVYRKAGDVHLKSDLILDVPIQVKGKKSNDLRAKTITYPVQLIDMKNYLEAGGTVFFVVYINSSGNKRQVFCSSLLPFDLKKIIKQTEGQVTKNITLRRLPKNKKDIANLFLGIARDMKKQKAAISCESITWEGLVKSGHLGELSIGYSSVPQKGALPFDYFFDHGAYLYVKLPPFGIDMPMEHLSTVDLISTTKEAEVCAGGKKFYDKYDIVFKKDVMELHFGKSTVHAINRKNGKEQKFNFTLAGTLSERICDEEFIITALEAGRFEVDGTICPLDGAEPEELASFNLPERKEHLDWLFDVKATMNALRVTEDLDCSNLTNTDEENIRILKAAVIDKKAVPLKDTGSVFGWFTIANLKILVCAIKRENKDGLYDIYGFADSPLEIRTSSEDGQGVPTTVYAMLDKEGILKCSNIDYDDMLESVCKMPLSNRSSDAITNLLLNLLRAYDESKPKREEILDAAINISEWIKLNDKYTPPTVAMLNYYQTIKRKRVLTSEEIKGLLSIIENKQEKEEFYVGAYLLLDKLEAAKAHFDLMAEEVQQTFRDYPIYHFWMKENKEELSNG